MDILPDKYCGDEILEKQLRKAGAKISISAIYGLFYGSLAAPHLVKPSQYTPFVFGEEGADFETMEEAHQAMGNLMMLWNILAGWEPEDEPCLFPAEEYQDSPEGLINRVRDNSSLITFFIKGLDLGGTTEDDFSDDAMKALKSLSEAGVFLDNYVELLQKEKESKGAEFEETRNLIIKLENVIADCIARINIGLKDARMRQAAEMSLFAEAQKKAYQAESTKIGRNELCPCGSGKKYKKCCGLSH
ncbi:MAG: SEC-C metal-binding domain-containing protein [Nitrospirota bacterium]|nr:SEC-C metal-binding domain-containing protein [Nitrospirota bacterium]